MNTKVGVIGLGFMGATHIAAYKAANQPSRGLQPTGCELVAVADPKERRRKGELWDVGGNIATTDSEKKPAFDAAEVRGYERADDLLNDPNVELVSICTRTDTHVDLATKAMRAGKHVLVEKPVALTADEIRNLAAVERETNKICMPAHCMRFWPGWTWLKEKIASNEFGKCHSATFTRLAAMPRWSSFFATGRKSGGALIDLHVHDTDFVMWCFGKPMSVTSSGRVGASGEIDHVTTFYRCDGGPAHLVAEGGWDHAPTFAFRMRYVAVFEKATADFDLTRDPPLLLCREDSAERIDLGTSLGYEGEVRAILRAIQIGADADVPTLDEAAQVADILAAERDSISSGKPVAI